MPSYPYYNYPAGVSEADFCNDDPPDYKQHLAELAEEAAIDRYREKLLEAERNHKEQSK
jgi:hypothetical protein